MQYVQIVSQLFMLLGGHLGKNTKRTSTVDAQPCIHFVVSNPNICSNSLPLPPTVCCHGPQLSKKQSEKRRGRKKGHTDFFFSVYYILHTFLRSKYLDAG